LTTHNLICRKPAAVCQKNATFSLNLETLLITPAFCNQNLS